MKQLENISSVYFLGIGGIGMSALARYFNSIGKKVSGYDRTPTPLTSALAQEGIAVYFTEDENAIDKNADLVVYTPAIPKSHLAFKYFSSHNIKMYKRSEVLGMISSSMYNVGVAGTHGKSTTSCLVAHIVQNSGLGCNAFLGAIAANYGTNFWSSVNALCVTEADEFDRSFLQLSPDVAVITSMDPDHLDIYGTAEKMEGAFIDFSHRIRKNGWLIYKEDLKRADELMAGNRVSYALQSSSAQASAKNVVAKNGAYRFDVALPKREIKNVELNMGGLHNVENAVAAIAVADILKIEEDKIKKAVASFKGVKRRFEYVIMNEEQIMIDDYAHHPEELRALIEGAQDMFPQKKITVIFQPHLFSRTQDLADGFAEVLSLPNETILLPIYPARELPIEGVSSNMILEKMTLENKQLLSKDELMQWIGENKRELIITAGAGDIDALVPQIKEKMLMQSWPEKN